LRPRKPQILRDELPPPPPYIPAINDNSPDDKNMEFATLTDPNIPPNSNPEDVFRTTPDSYGIYRKYSNGKPSITPDENYNLSDISDSPYLALDPSSSATPHASLTLDKLAEAAKSATNAVTTFFVPFQNASIYRLMTWFYNSSNTKSISELNSLVHDVILAPDFKPDDFVGFSAIKEHAVMDSYRESPSTVSDQPSPFEFDDTWINGKVEISVPCEGFSFESEAVAPKFTVEVHYRRLIEVIKSALSESEAEKFHMFPFRAFWKPASDEPEERIYSEIYTGDFWNDEYEKVQSAHQHGPNSHLEAIIISLMIWSDSMSLAQFGNAELWPIYLYIGNQSKYSRCKPTSFAAHHIAYFPKVCSFKSKISHLTFNP
jgi:hypothetical protein